MAQQMEDLPERYSFNPVLRWNPQVEEYFGRAYGAEHFALISKALTRPSCYSCIRVNTLKSTTDTVIEKLSTIVKETGHLNSKNRTLMGGDVDVNTGIELMQSGSQRASMKIEDEKNSITEKFQNPSISRCQVPGLDYVVFVRGSGPHTIDYGYANGRPPKEVIVSRKCAEAVLRGAQVYVPGVMACSAHVEKGDAVAVSVAVEQPGVDGGWSLGITRGTVVQGLLTDPYHSERSGLYIGQGITAMSRAGIFRASEGIAVDMNNRVFKLPSFYETIPPPKKKKEKERKEKRRNETKEHLLFGVYLAQVCLIGLFALQAAIVPVVLMAGSLVFSLIFHISISEALSPLLANLPRTLALELEELMGGGEPEMPLPAFDIDPASIPLPPDEDEEEDDETVVHETTGARGLARSMGVEGSPSLAKLVRKWTWESYVRKVSEMLHEIGLGPVLDRIDAIMYPVYSPNPSAIMRFLHPNTFDSFAHLRKMIPDDMPDPTATYPEDYIFKAYYPPEMWTPTPKLWLPRDDAGVSTQEIEHCKRYGRIVASDEGAWLGEDGRITCEVDEAPFWEDRAVY